MRRSLDRSAFADRGHGRDREAGLSAVRMLDAGTAKLPRSTAISLDCRSPRSQRASGNARMASKAARLVKIARRRAKAGHHADRSTSTPNVRNASRFGTVEFFYETQLAVRNVWCRLNPEVVSATRRGVIMAISYIFSGEPMTGTADDDFFIAFKGSTGHRQQHRQRQRRRRPGDRRQQRHLDPQGQPLSTARSPPPSISNR